MTVLRLIRALDVLHEYARTLESARALASRALHAFASRPDEKFRLESRREEEVDAFRIVDDEQRRDRPLWGTLVVRCRNAVAFQAPMHTHTTDMERPARYDFSMLSMGASPLV